MADQFLSNEELVKLMDKAGLISKAQTTAVQQKAMADQLRKQFSETVNTRPGQNRIASPLSPISAIGQIAGGVMGGQAQQAADAATAQVGSGQQEQNQMMLAALLRGQGGGGGPTPAGPGLQMPTAPVQPGITPPAGGLQPPAQPNPEGLKFNPLDWLKMGQNYGLQ